MTQPTRAEPATGLARPHFVVTGCARSATTYTARLLTEAGCACTHEAVFGPHSTRFDGWRDAQGDSSWLAVPFLSELPAGTVVIHQVREPVAAIDALVRFQMFSTAHSGLRQDAVAFGRYLRGGGLRAVLGAIDPRRRRERGVRRRRDFVAFLRQHCPEAFLEPSDVARAARHWISWNTQIEARATEARLVYRRIQVEHLDAGMLASLVELLGGDASPAAADTAVGTVSQTANRQPGGPTLGITRLSLGGGLASELESTARHFGYATEIS